MNIYSKGIILVLGAALSTTPLWGQDGPPAPPAGQQVPRDGGPRGGIRGPGGPDGGERGGWGGHEGGEFGRGGFGHGRRMGGHEFGLSRLLADPEIRQQAGISPEQFTKIRLGESTFRKSEIRNRADVEVKRLDLEELLSAEKPDRAAIDLKLQEISTAQLAMEKAAVGYRLDMQEAITPAQRERLRQAMRNRWQQRDERTGKPNGPSGRRGPRGPGQPSAAPAPDANRPPQSNN